MTSISGPGIGTSAVKDFVEKNRGTVAIILDQKSVAEEFYSFVFLITLPNDHFGVLDSAF